MLWSLTLGLGGTQRAEAYTKATILAESTLDAMGVAAPLVDGDAAELHEGPFRILASVRRFVDPHAPLQTVRSLALYQLAVTVSWREGPRQSSVSLTTLRLGRQ